MITEAQRHRPYTALEDKIGEELMDLLPASGWADVARKQDLAALATKDELRDSQRTVIFAMLAAMATHTGLLVTLITLLR
jgi:hypothetical protein